MKRKILLVIFIILIICINGCQTTSDFANQYTPGYSEQVAATKRINKAERKYKRKENKRRKSIRRLQNN